MAASESVTRALEALDLRAVPQALEVFKANMRENNLRYMDRSREHITNNSLRDARLLSPLSFPMFNGRPLLTGPLLRRMKQLVKHGSKNSNKH